MNRARRPRPRGTPKEPENKANEQRMLQKELQDVGGCTVAAVHLRALSGLGVELFRYGYVDKAQDVFEGLIGLDPSYADAHLGLGIAYARARRWQDALMCFERFEAIKPQEAEVDLQRAELFIGRGKHALAQKCLARARAKASCARRPDDRALQRVAAYEGLLTLRTRNRVESKP